MREPVLRRGLDEGDRRPIALLRSQGVAVPASVLRCLSRGSAFAIA
jgi:hypothetical protein